MHQRSAQGRYTVAGKGYIEVGGNELTQPSAARFGVFGNDNLRDYAAETTQQHTAECLLEFAFQRFSD